MIKIGWKAGAEQFSPGYLLSAVQKAEEVGFDFLDIVTPEAIKKAGCISARAEDHRAFA